MSRNFLFLCLGLVTNTWITTGTLSGVEKQILAHVDRAEPEAVELLREVVNINKHADTEPANQTRRAVALPPWSNRSQYLSG